MTFQVEFVELPEEESEANESDNLVISHSEESEDHHGQQAGGGGGEGLLEDNKVTFTLWRKVKVLKVFAKGEHGVICRPASAGSDKTPDKSFNWQVAADQDEHDDVNIHPHYLCLIIVWKEEAKENKASTREWSLAKPCPRFYLSSIFFEFTNSLNHPHSFREGKAEARAGKLRLQKVRFIYLIFAHDHEGPAE